MKTTVRITTAYLMQSIRGMWWIVLRKGDGYTEMLKSRECAGDFIHVGDKCFAYNVTDKRLDPETERALAHAANQVDSLARCTIAQYDSPEVAGLDERL